MPIPKKDSALQRKSAKDLVYETLCDWIIRGEMMPGEKLLDTELAAYFNVSRTPVREALQMLETQKLIKVTPLRWPAWIRMILKNATAPWRKYRAWPHAWLLPD